MFRLKSGVFHALLKPFGAFHHVDKTCLSTVDVKRHDSESRVHYRYHPAKPLSAGWYMLSVAMHGELLTEYLSVHDANGGVASLQLTSKSFSKRIIQLDVASAWLDFQSISNLTAGTGVQLSLTRITRSFARSRMQRKLFYGSSQRGGQRGEQRGAQIENSQSLMSNESLEALYERYSRRMQRKRSVDSYDGWTLKRAGNEYRNSSVVAGQEFEKLVTVVQIAEGKSAQTQQLSRRLQQVNTPYLCLLGPDVILEECFCDEISLAIEKNAHTQLLYSDHDVKTQNGARIQPCFKPAWNAEMLLSGNYVGQVVVLSTALIGEGALADRVLSLLPKQGKRVALDSIDSSSLIYACLLTLSPYLSQNNVCRLPVVLYSYPESRQGVRSYLSTGSDDERVVRHHARQLKLPVRVQNGLIKGAHAVNWNMPMPAPTVDIIIPSKDQLALLHRCVQSILENTDYPSFRITIVDNGSCEQETLSWYEAMRAETRLNVLFHPGEFNYSALNNFAVANTHSDVLVLLNNDTEVIESDWLNQLIVQAVRKEVACVGAKLHYGSGLIQHAGVIVGLFGMAGHAHRLFEHDEDGYCGRLKIPHNVSAVTGACLAVKRTVYLALGQLDEVNLKVAYNDVDFCLRAIQAGYQNIWTPYAQLYHHESASRGNESTYRKQKRFRQEFAYMKKRWAIDQMTDPAYNPNLTLDSEDFSLSLVA